MLVFFEKIMTNVVGTAAGLGRTMIMSDFPDVELVILMRARSFASVYMVHIFRGLYVEKFHVNKTHDRATTVGDIEY